MINKINNKAHPLIRFLVKKIINVKIIYKRPVGHEVP
jgi:hypothetical protein